MKKISILALFLFILLIGGVCLAVKPLEDPALEEKAKKLETQLIAPCCWVEPISTHISPVSEKMKKQVRVMLSQGMPPEEILDAFVKEYGYRILSNPPAKGFFLNLYLIPPLVIIIFAIAVILFLRKWVKEGHKIEVEIEEKKPEISPEDQKLLEEEMKKEGY